MLILYALGLLFFVLRCYWHRYNKPFTRRLKRKSVVTQNHRFKAKPQWVTDAVIRLKIFLPAAGVRTITNNFNRIYGKRETVSKSYVAKVLRNYRYAIAAQRRDMRNRKPIALPANATWGLDLCGKQDIAGGVHPILGIIDHGSRMVITLNAIANMNFYTLRGMCLWRLDSLESRMPCAPTTHRS